MKRHPPLTDTEVVSIRQLHTMAKPRYSLKELAAQFGISIGYAGMICQGKRRKVL